MILDPFREAKDLQLNTRSLLGGFEQSLLLQPAPCGGRGHLSLEVPFVGGVVSMSSSRFPGCLIPFGTVFQNGNQNKIKTDI